MSSIFHRPSSSCRKGGWGIGSSLFLADALRYFGGVRYSAPWQLIGRQVEVRETKAEIQIFEGPRLVGAHKKAQDLGQGRATLLEHRPPRGQGGTPSAPAVELIEAAPRSPDTSPR